MGQSHLATARITVPYIVDGRTHKARMFVRGLTLVGSDWMINSRALDANDTLWTDAADSFAHAISELAPSTSTVGVALLEKLTGLVWVTQDTHTLAWSPSAQPTKVGSQCTLTLRETNGYKAKIIVLDTYQAPPQKIKTPTGGDSNMDAFIEAFTVGAANAHEPYHVMVGASNNYLAGTAFVSMSVFLNRKVTRRAGA
jgi:hypothetical protein